MDPTQDLQNELRKENEELVNYIKHDMRLNEKVNGLYPKIDKCQNHINTLAKQVSLLIEKDKHNVEKIERQEQSSNRQAKEFRDMMKENNKVLIALDKSNLNVTNCLNNLKKDIDLAKNPFKVIRSIAAGVAVIVIGAYIVYVSGFTGPAKSPSASVEVVEAERPPTG